MKRIGNLYDSIFSLENLKLADKKAKKGKSNQYGVKTHLKNEDINIENLHLRLKTETYKTSEYSNFEVYEQKHRVISRLPYYP